MTGLAAAVVARMVEQRDLMQALDEHLSSVSVRVTSRDRSVRVEVGALGDMTGLWLGPNAYRNGADALAQLVVDTAHAAAEQAEKRQRYLLSEFAARMNDVETRSLTKWDGTTVRPAGQVPADGAHGADDEEN